MPLPEAVADHQNIVAFRFAFLRRKTPPLDWLGADEGEEIWGRAHSGNLLGLAQPRERGASVFDHRQFRKAAVLLAPIEVINSKRPFAFPALLELVLPEHHNPI